MECPECGSDDIWIDDDTEDGLVICTCDSCGHEWEEDGDI